jgi:hypothetical protein
MLPIAALVLACSGTAQRGNAQPAPRVSAADAAMPSPTGEVVAEDVGSARPVKDQPPYIKLKLGHFTNKQLGIGVVIDLTEVIDNVAKIPPGKIRFDGETKVWKLKAQRGSRDRVDYVNDEGHLMLETWTDGRRAVFVYDPTNEKWSDEIDVVRDGDADPL